MTGENTPKVVKFDKAARRQLAKEISAHVGDRYRVNSGRFSTGLMNGSWKRGGQRFLNEPVRAVDTSVEEHERGRDVMHLLLKRVIKARSSKKKNVWAEGLLAQESSSSDSSDESSEEEIVEQTPAQKRMRK